MTNSTTHGLTLAWTLDASPADVFRAWTEPAKLGWFFNDTMPVPEEPIELDLRVGGAWRQLMVENPEKQYWTGGVYREIVRDEKLSFTWGAVGGWPELDLERLDESPVVTILLAAEGDRTEMTLHVEFPAQFSEADVERWLALGIREGWQATVARLRP
jgi:uncharacterized protein YndB with AHSA1/START domain